MATITGLLFYVTSADSGALVLGNFTSKLKDINSDAPNWLRIFWSVAIGLLTLGMLMTNGISALQNTTVIMGLPFSFVIFFVMAGLYKSLESGRLPPGQREPRHRPAPDGPPGSSELEEAPVAADELPGHALYQTDDGDGVLPGDGGGGPGAAAERRGGGIEEPAAGRGWRTLATSICWCTWATSRTLSTRSGRSSTSVPGFTYRARSGKSTYYRLETFLLEGSQGNDLMDYSKEQVITDILDQYERHLNFIHLHREAPGNSVMFPGWLIREPRRGKADGGDGRYW